MTLDQELSEALDRLEETFDDEHVAAVVLVNVIKKHARLIAAAPELLEALCDITSERKLHFSLISHNPCDCGTCKALERGLAAIRKAKGDL
jgi:hypothetical protein